MTIDPVLFLRIVGIVVMSIFMLLLLRHLFNILGFNDAKYPIVQHAERKQPPPPSQVTFLPGSKVYNTVIDEDGSIEEIMEKGLHLTHLEREEKKYVHPILGTIKDLRKTIIVENLMERKWDK